MSRIILLLCAGLVAPGCDRDADRVGDVALDHEGAAIAVEDVPAATATISPGYLAGPWCNVHYSAGGEREDQQIDYVFNEDGTLLYQTNPDSAVDQSGKWKLDDAGLSVGPAIWVMATEIHSVAPDRFVLGDDNVHTVFTRGACPAAS